MTRKAVTDVDQILRREGEKNKKELNSALILPFSDDYPFCTNGVYFFAGRMGSGKTYGVIRHIMITDRLMEKPYYDQIVVSATSGSMDKTSKTFMNNCSAPVTNVDDKQLMAWLNKNVKQKSKYYAINKFIQSNMRVVTDDMKKIIEKHKLLRDDKKSYDMRRLASYILSKLSKYPFKKCPSNTFLILDDYGGHTLLNKPDSPLANFITKVRHYNYTVCIMCQTWRMICLNLKRLCTDFVIFQGYSQQDFETMVTQSGSGRDKKELWEKYKNLKTPRSYMRLHIVAGKEEFVDVEVPQKTLL